jgi:hypothetical protein
VVTSTAGLAATKKQTEPHHPPPEAHRGEGSISSLRPEMYSPGSRASTHPRLKEGLTQTKLEQVLACSDNGNA